MSTIEPTALPVQARSSNETATSLLSESWLPTLLSVIAGMVELIGFLTLDIFTAHVAGNIVVIARP